MIFRLFVIGLDIFFFLVLIGLFWSFCGVGNEFLGFFLFIRLVLFDFKSVFFFILLFMIRFCDLFRIFEELILRYMYGLGVRGSNYLFYVFSLYGYNSKNMFLCVCSSLNL